MHWHCTAGVCRVTPHTTDDAPLSRREWEAYRAEIVLWRDAHLATHAAGERDRVERAAAMRRAIDVAAENSNEVQRSHAQAHQREHAMAQVAIDKAERTATERFENLNEARGRAADERVTFASRTEVVDKVEAITGRLDALDRVSASTTERLSSVVGNAARIEALERLMASSAGRDQGIGQFWGVLVAVASAAIALGGFIGKSWGGG